MFNKMSEETKTNAVEKTNTISKVEEKVEEKEEYASTRSECEDLGTILVDLLAKKEHKEEYSSSQDEETSSEEDEESSDCCDYSSNDPRCYACYAFK